LLVGAGSVAGAGLVTALATPAASLGPTLNGIHSTQWYRGRRLVDDTGKPYAADEIQIGTFYTALPEHGEAEHLDAGLLVVRLPAEFIHLPPERESWAPQGIMAYSKICPHAACAISLYRYPTYAPTSASRPAFTCPCHYSTFLPGEGGRLIFGPAGRALPQLPLMIDTDGNLRAAGGFGEDIGPSWWNVHRGQT
jgi:ubiquinol-cytochrome c reductase iron-sulfur subunit